MKASKVNSYCGLPGIGLKEILGFKRSTADLSSWFWDAQLYFTHKGRTAIRKACELINIQPGDEILMPSYNCGSEIDPIIKGGATVVLYRVDRSSMIDVDDLESRITGKTTAIYVTHYFGFPQQVDRIKELCETHSIFLIEDCALALFSKDGFKKLGTTGDIAVFSLAKTLPVPDGGVLVANNPDILKEPWVLKSPNQKTIYRATLPLLKSSVMRGLSSGVATRPLYSLTLKMLRHNKTPAQQEINLPATTWPEMLPDMYYDERLSNGRVSALSSRILLSFDVDFITAKRRENYETMLSLLKGGDSIKPLFRELPPGVCPLYFPVIVNNRNELQSKLNELGIDARAWWKGYHRELPWESFPDACF